MTETDHDSLHFLHVPSVVVTLQTLCEDCRAGSSAPQQYDAPTERAQYRAHLIDLNSKTHYAVSDVHVTVHRDKFLIIKPTRCNNFSNLFWNETLHVLDSSSVHHQEFFAVHTANLYDIYHCCVYSEKLLMMDRGTV
jgi:hypothetical protein